jgi:hypothetical protein
MVHVPRIRTALVEPEMDKLGGIVEVDETFIGGKARISNKHGGHNGTHGGVGRQNADHWRCQPQGQRCRPKCLLASAKRQAAEASSARSCPDKVSLLATDESKVYEDLTDYNHETVDHRAPSYVIGAVHTNTIEGFWSIFKRGIVGSFHKVSRKYMPLYVAEFQFRYNNRFNEDIFGTAIGGC